MARTTTRQVTLIFLDPRQVPSETNAMQFSGDSAVVREDFPDLLNAITARTPGRDSLPVSLRRSSSLAGAREDHPTGLQSTQYPACRAEAFKLHSQRSERSSLATFQGKISIR